jgi:hypothetical protein
MTWGAAVVVPVAFGVVTLAYGLRGDTYEGLNLARSGLGPGVPAAELQLFRRTLAAGVRHFSGGWADAFRGLPPAGGDAVLAVAVVSLIVGPVLWRLAPRDPGPRSWKEIRPYLELALLALCSMPVGFLLFLPTPWLQTNWRVFYLSSVAAAVVFAVLCTLIAAAAGRARRHVLVGLGGLLVALGLFSGLAQHRRYAEWAQAQRRILLGIVRTAPQVKPGATILLIDRPPYVGVRSWAVCGVVTDCVERTLRYVYGRRDLEAVFCAPGESPPRTTSEACRFEQDGFVVEYLSPWGKPRRVVRRYPYDRLLAFDIREGSARLLTTLDQYAAVGSAAAYDPGPTITEAPIPRLARVMLDP